MIFTEMDPRIIRPAPWNSNVVSHENELKLKASLQRNGFFRPVIVRETSSFDGARDVIYECVGGWHRCEQAIELGYETVPVVNLGPIDEEKAKEISLADNARYGIDDTLKLSEILEGLDIGAIENTMPWTRRDIDAITADLSVDIDDLDLSDKSQEIEDDPDEDLPAPKAPRTHQVIRFRCTLEDAAKIYNIITRVQQEQGFTKEDDLTNAGDALSYIVLSEPDDD